LRDQSGAVLAIARNGTFTFPTQVSPRASFSVTVDKQPSGPAQSCVVKNGSGTIQSGNVTGVSIQCGNTISQDNASDVAATGDHAIETLLQFASFIGERLTYLSGHLAATATEQCSSPLRPHPGSATYTFSDNDNSGTLSAGDEVTIVLNGCESPSLGDYITGALTLSVGAPPQPADHASGFSATTDLSQFQLLGLQLTGPLQVAFTASDSSRYVQAQVAGAGVTMTYSGGGFAQPDNLVVVSANASRAIDYTTAQYNVQLAADYRSTRLNGEFSLVTKTPLTGAVGIYPVGGVEVFHGGPSALTFSAQNVTDNQYLAAALDADGSGNYVPLQGFFWEQNFTGFPWWEPRGGFLSAGIEVSPTFQTFERDQLSFRLLFAQPEVDPVNAIISTDFNVQTPIKLFFSGPVDGSRSTLSFIPQASGTGTIPATLTLNGAIVTVTAQTQLAHGFQYDLQSQGYVQGFNEIGPGAGVSLRLTTTNDLQADASASPAVAAPGQAVTLKSTRSFSTTSSIAHYSWQQTSGTTVNLVGADTATARFTIPATSHDGESLVFNLGVTDANGATDSAPVTVFVLADLRQPFLYYREAQGAAVGQAPAVSVLEYSGTGTVRTEFDTTLNIFRFLFGAAGGGSSDELQFFTPTQPIAPGTYTSDNTPGGMPFFVQSLPFQCNSPSWQFTIYEAVAAGDGTAAQFSADFSQTCPGGLPPFIGSVRVNSAVPLP